MSQTLAGQYTIRLSDSRVTVVQDDDDTFHFEGPTVISDTYTVNAAHVRKLVELGIMRPAPSQPVRTTQSA